MTSWVGLSTALGNVVVLLGLAAAAASPRLSRHARLIISTFAFACAWLMTAAFDAMRAPDWTLFMGGTVITVSIVVAMATLHLWTQASDMGETRPPRRGDEGGRGPRRNWPHAPQPGGGDSDPSWWPEFERRLSLYVAERQGENRLPVVLPSEPSPNVVGSRRRPTASPAQPDDCARAEVRQD